MRGRLVVHGHFYQPLRVGPVHGRVPREPAGGPVPRLERPDQRRVLPPERRARQPRTHLVGPGTHAHRLISRVTAPEVLAGFAASDRDGRRQRDRPGLPPHDPAARRPPPTGGPRSAGASATSSCGSAAGRTAIWLPETAVDLRPSGSSPTHGIEATILAPWQADVPAIDTRRPYRVELGDGTRPRRVLRRRPVRRRLLRFRRDGRRRRASRAERFEPRTAPAPAGRRPRATPPPGRDRRQRTASSTATTSRSATCSCTASSRRSRRRPIGASTSSASPTPSRTRTAGPHPAIRIRSAPRGAAITASRAGAPNARTSADGRWKAPLRRRWTGWQGRSTP